MVRLFHVVAGLALAVFALGIQPLLPAEALAAPIRTLLLDPVLTEVEFPDDSLIDTGTADASLPGLSLFYQDGIGSIDAIDLGAFATARFQLHGVIPDLGEDRTRVYFQREWTIEPTEPVTLYLEVRIMDAETGELFDRYTTAASGGLSTTRMFAPAGRAVVFTLDLMTTERFAQVRPTPAIPPFDLDLSGEWSFFVIPEPTTSTLLGLGLLALAFGRFRNGSHSPSP